ncbi:MAG: hypothetical protein AAF458_13340 [Pseudomonadota bacterium]
MKPERHWVNLSVTPSEEARALGFDNHSFNRMLVRTAEFLLFHDCNVAFGHDWRPDGVMRAVSELAETAASGGSLSELPGSGAQMLNLVPGSTAGLSQEAIDTANAASGVLRVHALQDLADPGNHENLYDSAAGTAIAQMLGSLNACPSALTGVCELWILRYALSMLSPRGGRVCIGGKTSGYGGLYAGIAEEAFFALRHGQPLYVVGGFGGAARVVASVLAGERQSRAACLKPKHEIDPNADTVPVSLAHRVGIPLDGLEDALREFDLGKLHANNGLTPDQNRRLFSCTDIEEALGLVMLGLRGTSTS